MKIVVICWLHTGDPERFHRSLKAALRARLHDGNWIDELPWVLLGLRTATVLIIMSTLSMLLYYNASLYVCICMCICIII